MAACVRIHNSGPRPVIQIGGQGRKYKYKLRRNSRYIAKSGPRLVIKLLARAGKYKLGARAGKYKLGARASKYILGARARAGGQAKDRGPGNTKALLKTRKG